MSKESRASLRSSIIEAQQALIRSDYIQEGVEEWYIHGSDFSEYLEFFKNIVPPDVDILKILQGAQNPTVIDLMSPPDAIEDLFDALHQEDKMGISVSLSQMYSDEERQIYHVEGDVMHSGTWKDINRILGGRKANLIVERALSGTIFLPVNKDFYDIAQRQLWKMLNPNGGIILAQTTSAVNFAKVGINIYGWVHKLRESGIDAEYRSAELNSGKIFIQRHPNSPARLPSFP